MEIPVRSRQYFSFIFAALFAIGASGYTNATYGASQAGPASHQENQQTPTSPTATTRDGKFAVTVRDCQRSYDAVQLRKSRVDCTFLIESKIDGVVKVTFDWNPPVVLLTDDTGEQIPAKFKSPLDSDGADSDQAFVSLEPSVPVSRHFVFVGASEQSNSASLTVGFQYGSAAAVGYNGGWEHLVVRNVPLHVR